MLRPVQLHRHTYVGTQQIDFQASRAVEPDRPLPLPFTHAGSQDHEVGYVPSESVLQAVEMVVSLGQHERRSSVVRRLDDVVANATVALLVGNQLLVQSLELRSLVGFRIPSWLECRRLHEDDVIERVNRRLSSCGHSVANGTALHEDNWVVTVLASDGRRQPHNESRLGLAYHLLEAPRRQVVTLVDDQVAVVGQAVLDDTFPDETLDNGDVEQSGRPGLASADSTDRLWGQVEERREALDPLLEQRTPMHKHERAYTALCDEPGGDHRLAKRRRGGQHAGVVSQHRGCRRLLLGPQLALKGRLERAPGVALLANGHTDADVGQGLADIIETPSR